MSYITVYGIAFELERYKMAWYLWVLLFLLVWPPCYVWLVRFIFSLESMYEATDKQVLAVVVFCIPFSIPVCLFMFMFGTIFKSLAWATNRG